MIDFTDFAEIMMIIRLNWQYFVALGLMIGLAIFVCPGVVKSQDDYEQKIWEEKYSHTLGNIQHTLEKAKKQSNKKYGD